MTTFQVLIDAFFSALTHLIPISNLVPDSVFQNGLHWSLPLPELQTLILLTGSISFLIFFRFDWLGLLSAAVTSTIRPMSLKAEQRTLDQHTLLFVILVFFPAQILKWAFGSMTSDHDFMTHPLLLGALTLLLGIGFRASSQWNKRILGLNHLRLTHGIAIALITLLSNHPVLPLIGLLWIGFGFCNYHYEAIFKYSMLILGISIFSRTATLLASTGLRESLDQVGHLNSIAVIVVGFSVFWIGLENLQKNLSEHTLKSFQWLNLASGVYFMIMGLIKN
jgi:undecaprenyl pyrophosphate phosphatase UppP